jgi:lysyl-tRNA synthetase, class I
MYKAWPFIEAKKLIIRARKHKKQLITLESGYGPSGLPHIGTFAEAARTSFVIRALKKLAPELEARFIAFSDDMDGLRSIPENVPNQDMLLKELGKPLCNIPDPYGEFESYSANMNNRLKIFLDRFGFEYKLQSSADIYKSGGFNEGLETILKKHAKIIKIFTSTIAEDKRATWSPFLPVCENCGKNTTTQVKEYDPVNNTLRYECINSPNDKISPCQHKGETSIFNGAVKVGWKIDWALRWHTLAIDYEMYGKDLIDSAIISEKIIRLLGSEPPVFYKYELFLDENGKKISKKIGNGVSFDEWSEYASTDVLLNFLLAKPNQPKRMALPLIPKAVDSYLNALKSFDGKEDSLVHIIEGKEVHQDYYSFISSQIDYSLIVNLVRALNVDEPEFIMEYLIHYDPSINEAQSSEFYKQLVQKAILYNQNVFRAAAMASDINTSFDPHLELLLAKLKEFQDAVNPDDVQTACFSVAKENDLEFKEWFTYIYQVLLGQDSGPKLGPFICLYGIEATVNKINEYLTGRGD